MTDSEYTDWLNKNNIFVSYPKYKFLIGRVGFYILPSYKFSYFPKFYFMKTKYFIEMGFSFAGYIFEIQHNKIEKI